MKKFELTEYDKQKYHQITIDEALASISGGGAKYGR